MVQWQWLCRGGDPLLNDLPTLVLEAIQLQEQAWITAGRGVGAASGALAAPASDSPLRGDGIGLCRWVPSLPAPPEATQGHTQPRQGETGLGKGPGVCEMVIGGPGERARLGQGRGDPPRDGPAQQAESTRVGPLCCEGGLPVCGQIRVHGHTHTCA